MIALTPEGDQLARRFIAALEGQLRSLLEEWSDGRQREAAAMPREIAYELDHATQRGRR